jgi:hypothetical protein
MIEFEQWDSTRRYDLSDIMCKHGRLFDEHGPCPKCQAEEDARAQEEE